ncbi:tetratricopeptide repeat protein [Snuella sedimenti]|uniref:Tetratricopeptide repeat protein n=1 Tax=Snuella sedimenti TaxID=2798802 RepID=A0A8J7LRX6_9FLAO|nr:tetratricopeptide repeat protein [Snuella sedimenti]MBJ6367755.1 tetratricopeptide repeat protein [Snuella sedimenti]
MFRLTLLSLLILFKIEAQTSDLNKADSLYINGNYSKAIENYKAYKEQSEVLDKIAKAYVAIGNYDEALKNYKASIDVNPEDALLKYEYAKLLHKTKKYNEAAVVFNELVYLNHKNPNYHYELGLALERINDSTAANRFYNAIELDATHQKAIYSLAKLYLKKGKNTLADKYIDIGLSSYENNKGLINLKAQNFYLRKQYEKAAVWFEKLIALNESSQFIHEKLSHSYAKILEYEKAIEQGLEALKYEPNNTSNLYVLGQLYERINDFENAEKYITESLELQDVSLEEGYKNLGMVLNRQKKHKEAIAAFRKAIHENPNSDSAHFYLVYTKDRYYEDIDTRMALYEGFKEKFPKSTYLNMVNFRMKALKKEKFMKNELKGD